MISYRWRWRNRLVRHQPVVEPNRGFSDKHKPNRFTRIERKRKMPAHGGDSTPSVGGHSFATWWWTEWQQYKKDTYNTAVLSDAPCDWFYRCPPTSGPYVLHRFRVLSLPANLRPLRPASDRILGVSHTSGMMSTFHLRLYSIYTQIAMLYKEV